MAAVVTEPLTHGATGVWGQVLEWGGVGSGGNDDNGVLHGVVGLQAGDELGDGGLFLADGDVDAVPDKKLAFQIRKWSYLQFLGLVVTVVPGGLVQHGVEGDGGFTGLTITNDQLTLATANWDKGVNGLETGLHGLVDGFTGDDTWGLQVDLAALFGVEWSLSVEWVAEGIDDTAEKGLADWDVDDGAGTLDGVTLLDETIVTEDDNTDVVTLQVEGLVDN